MSIVKNQHYISECLLYHFTNKDEKLFEALLEAKKIYPSSPNASMCEKYVYEDDRLKKNTIENYFARIESDIAPEINNIIDDICKHGIGEAGIDIVKARIEKLLPVFIIFYYRSGALLTEFASIKKEDKIPLLSQKILDERYLKLLSETIINNYNFAIIQSDNNFILSDQYISTASLKIKGQFMNICNRTIGIRDTVIFIPISASYYIVYWHSNSSVFSLNRDEVNKLNDEELEKVNYAIINNSYYKCASENEMILRKMIDGYDWGSPTHIYTGNDKTGYYAGAIKKKEVFYYKEDKEAWNSKEQFYFKDGWCKIGRNELCFCGSKKKFKKCHEDIYNRLRPMLNDLMFDHDRDVNKYVIPGVKVIEMPIDQWSGYK